MDVRWFIRNALMLEENPEINIVLAFTIISENQRNKAYG